MGDDIIHVIIAEDIPVLLEDLIEILSVQEDIEVVGTATSGSELLALAETTEFDVCLTDIEMEDSHAGIRAAERILALKPECKVIFLTIHETRGIVLAAMATGAVDYVIKGCDGAELVSHIHAVMQGEPMLDAQIQQIVMQEYQRLRKSEQSLLFFINNLSRLTQVEKELVRYLLEGYNLTEIAKQRVVEKVTIKTQIKSMLRKFGCARTKEVVELIRSLGIEHLFM